MPINVVVIGNGVLLRGVNIPRIVVPLASTNRGTPLPPSDLTQRIGESVCGVSYPEGPGRHHEEQELVMVHVEHGATLSNPRQAKIGRQAPLVFV